MDCFQRKAFASSGSMASGATDHGGICWVLWDGWKALGGTLSAPLGLACKIVHLFRADNRMVQHGSHMSSLP